MRRFRARAVTLLAVTLVAGVVITAGSAGGNTKPYTAAFDPTATVSAGTATVNVAIKNLTTNQSLGSLNIDGSAFGANALTNATISGSTTGTVANAFPTSLIQLRNLNLSPRQTLNVAITLQASATCGSYTWGIQAKQSNDFNGAPGNDFTLQSSGSNLTTLVSTGCSLAWVAQPANAYTNKVITNSNYNDAAAKVAVKLVDSTGHIVEVSGPTVALEKTAGSGSTFSGSTAQLSNGVATFSTFKSSTTGSNLKVQARDAAATPAFQRSADSGEFFITTGGADCTGVSVCQFSTTLENSQVDTTATGSFNFVALNGLAPYTGTTAPEGCVNFKGTGATAAFEEIDSRSGSGALDFTYYIKDRDLKRAYGANYGQPNVPLCAAGKMLVNNQPVECNRATQTPFATRNLGTDGKFDGTYGEATCGADGYWSGVLGTFQDPKPPFDRNVFPLITGWGTSPDGIYRTFTIHVPSGWDWRTGA